MLYHGADIPSDFMWIIAFLIIGLVLIFFEFFFPTALLAILGVAALGLSLIFVCFQFSLLLIILYVLGLIGLVVGLCRTTLRQFYRSARKGELYLSEDQEGFVASNFDASLIGKEGKASTDLKPSGYIYVNQKRYAALSESGFIARGTPVYVVDGRGSYLVVVV